MIDSLISNAPLVWKGLRVTLQVSAMVLGIGTTIGIMGGLTLLYGVRPLRWAVRFFVDTIRGIPLLVLIFAVFYGGPVLLEIRLDAMMAGVAALSLFCGAHVSEVIRGGVSSIPKGQTDAGKAIGLTFVQRLRYVIFPQALRRLIPPWTNTAVEIVKASSLISLVSVIDLMLAVDQIIGRTRETLFYYGVAAVIYFCINYTISFVGMRVEKRFTYS